MSTPLYLSNNFIRKALQENIPLSPAKLQSLIYLAYRDYLQRTGQKLFGEPIVVSDGEPSVDTVYAHFKPFGADSIDKFYRDSKDNVHLLSEDAQPFGAVVNAVWAAYKGLGSAELSDITRKAVADSQAASESVRTLGSDSDDKPGDKPAAVPVSVLTPEDAYKLEKEKLRQKKIVDQWASGILLLCIIAFLVIYLFERSIRLAGAPVDTELSTMVFETLKFLMSSIVGYLFAKKSD